MPTIHCPRCTSRYNAPYQALGRWVTCPKCGEGFAADAGPDAIPPVRKPTTTEPSYVSYSTQKSARASSTFALISFVASAGGIAATVLGVLLWVAAFRTIPTPRPELTTDAGRDVPGVVVGQGLAALGALSLLAGIALGITSLIRGERNKPLAIIGILLSGIPLLVLQILRFSD